jgi:gliding motility-associated-like protein
LNCIKISNSKATQVGCHSMPELIHLYFLPKMKPLAKIQRVFDVFVRPLPDATFSYSPQQPTEDEPLVVFTAGAQDLDSHLWTINGDNFGNESVAEYQFRDSGLYVIQLSVLQDGCESDSRADILFVRKFEFLGVNAFSPNNDGVNDLFIPNFTGVSDFTYVIYNRWGAKIFEGNRSTPWDGTYDSKPAMAGIYFVIIEAVEPDGRQYFLNQSLQLLR